MNEAQYRNENRIAEAVREGHDLWNRETVRFTRIEGNLDVPPILKEGDEADRERLRYMLDRDGLSAGFSDYPKDE
jgi:beta-1,4-mannosyl-glycoprotein beta-1,4-N-acetylglucosaminyltransferase